MIKKVRHWIVDRFALEKIYEGFLDRRVPRSPWHSGDGSTLLLLLATQIITGALLALTYSPAAESAYDSVVHITERQILGWFVRGLHYWSAGMIVIVLFYHLFRQILQAGYKAPREGTWIIGVFLFFLMLLMAYTGYLLRWDERAVYGFRVMLHMLYRVPVIGESLVVIAQGGPEMGPQTLTRLYASHVIIMPLLILALTGYHLFLIVQRGTISHTEQERPVETGEEQKRVYKRDAHSPEKGEDFFPSTTFKSSVMAGTIFTVAVLLTIALGPAKLFAQGNLVDSAQPAEEWWFWWLSGLIALLPPAVAPWAVVLLPVLTFTLLLALPLLDRSPERGARARQAWILAIAIIVVGMLLLTDYRRRSPFTGWPEVEPPRLPVGVVLTGEAEQGRRLFARYGCNSCHAVAGSGRSVAVDFATIDSPRSVSEMRRYILRPPPGVGMPAYEGRLTDEELAAIVSFCMAAQTFPLQL